MAPPDRDSETRMDASFIRAGESPQTWTARMLFCKLLRRPGSADDHHKFPLETGFYKLDDEIPDFSEAQSSEETRGHESGSLDECRDLYSNLSYLSFAQGDEVIDASAAPVPAVPVSAPPAPSVPSMEHALTSIESPSLEPHSLGSAPASPNGSEHIPMIYTWDPNLNTPIDDPRLEPIHAVVSQYSRTLNDAFFGDLEESEPSDVDDMEHQVKRRGKFRRALRGLKRKQK